MASNPRPRKYATAAERQAAYRDRYAVLQIRVTKEKAETLERIAQARDIPRADLIADLLSYALANRDWFNAPAYSRSIVTAPQARRVATKFQVSDVDENDDENDDDNED